MEHHKKLWPWLKHNWQDILFILVLVGLSIFVSYKNYTPNTYLTGWDNLHPEFNFSLNVGRSLSGVWQEYQGLGLLGGMAHSADLPRQLILWAFSFVIPLNFIRYFWTFLMLALGPVGVYFLVKPMASKLAAFVSAFFYLFNLVTVQTFFTPFETFVAFYAFLPWLLAAAGSYLKTGDKKRLLTYFLVSIIATCAFYVQTLFIVYAIFLGVFAIHAIIKHKKSGVERSLKLGFVTLFVNAFWLLPVIYFAITSGGIPGASHINSIATPETQLMNLARANLSDLGSLKSYWFDYYDVGEGGKFDYLYKNWIDHTSPNAFTNISYFLFGVSVIGLIFSDFSYIILLLISIFMLLSGAVHAGPLLSEIFRNAFTKWGNVLILVTSVGLGTAVFKSKKLGFLIGGVIITASLYLVFPVFQGNLISKSMQVKIPNDYFAVFDYFKTQDKTKRIAIFPLTDFWGWHFYDWGARGSGFLWYGISQPILDRTFDVWSPNNENFYSDLSYAVSYGTPAQLESVFEKYQISYLLFDESIFQPGDPSSPKNIQDQKNVLESLPAIQKIKSIGKITIYEHQMDGVNSFVSAPQTLFESAGMQKASDTPEIVESFSKEQGYVDAKNCGLKGLGSVVKKKVDGGNFYGAYDGGVECDYFYYPTIDYGKAYLMRIKGKNTSGRSLKFYLFNVKSGKSDRVELLPSGEFDKFFEIPPTGEGAGQGYTLNVETRSFGSQKSENVITGIEFYPATFKGGSLQGEYSIQNDLKVLSVRKYGTWAYVVDVEGSGTLELGQGYENGWIAFPANIFHFQFTTFHLLEHTKINSWANGWTVSVNSLQTTDYGSAVSSRPSTVVLVDWPQLLEFLGLGILGITILVLLLNSSRKS